MKVTLNHPESKNGFPVILNGKGEVMPEDVGISAVLSRYGITHEEFAAHCGILPTTLNRYGRGAKAPGNVLNLLGTLIRTRGHSIASGEVPKLTELESEILSLRARGNSFGEIAKITGLKNRQRVHQVYRSAVGKKSISRR